MILEDLQQDEDVEALIECGAVEMVDSVKFHLTTG